MIDKELVESWGTPRQIEPEFSGGGPYYYVVVELPYCGTCKAPMIGTNHKNLFPKFVDLNLDSQMKRGGIKFISPAKDKNDDKIRDECAAAGKATFVCALCGVERPSSDVQESYGSPPEILCKPCYETQPAKVWREKEKELYETHRWDFS